MCEPHKLLDGRAATGDFSILQGERCPADFIRMGSSELLLETKFPTSHGKGYPVRQEDILELVDRELRYSSDSKEV